MPVHPLHADSYSSNYSSPSIARLVEQQVRARRRWVFRSLALLTLTSVGLFLTVIWQRDRLDAENAVQRMGRSGDVTRPVGQLEAAIKNLGLLPAVLPQQEESGRFTYASYQERFFAIRTGGPAIIAASTEVRLILRPNGRAVIVYDHGKVRSEWLTSSEFNRKVNEQNDRIAAFETELRARPLELP
jgi:hypothetical protein